MAALPYQEPSIETILILSSFLFLLNVINNVFDRLIYCGLIGQVLIGVAFGTPGAKWLHNGTEQLIVQLGYLGLILLIYEGGLSTNFRSLKANAGLSALVALTGICLPIAFAFCLQSLASTTPLQAFAAGTALCCTSLGTTFTILNTCDLAQTRLGTVLASAAMMDDVVGLVMVQVISRLGPGSSSHLITVAVVRPIAVSAGLTLLVLLTCRYLVKPFSSLIRGTASSAVMHVLNKQEAALISHTILLFGFVAAASYAGTSNLFAAYLAGASIGWYDSEVAQSCDTENSEDMEVTQSTSTVLVQEAAHNEDRGNKSEKRNSLGDDTDHAEPGGQNRTIVRSQSSLSGVSVYKKYMEQSVARILKPFFFVSANKIILSLRADSMDQASIGFSIPITRMFTGTVVWRGIVFTILMLIGKFVTGIWLIRIATPSGTMATKIKPFLKRLNIPQWSFLGLGRCGKGPKPETGSTSDDPASKAMPNAPLALTTDREPSSTQSIDRPRSAVYLQRLSSATPTAPEATSSTKKSRSLYPASIIGTAMMARGEIGFLIAAVAESKGTFASPNDSAAQESSGSTIYLVVIWAVVLCTVIGPVSVGLLVRRVKRLQRQHREHGGGEDPLGVWRVL